jgi:hypothetical protein
MPPPEAPVALRPGEIVVEDNGTGIAEETVRSIRNLDAAGVTTTTPIQLNDDGQASHWA